MNSITTLNLETAVGREKDVQDIDVHGEFKKSVVTLLVMRTFLNLSGASRACAAFRDPTAVSRLNVVDWNMAFCRFNVKVATMNIW